jgi:hypothetical protein
MTEETAAVEAAEIDKQVPWPYTPGQYYPVEYKGRKFEATRKAGRGRQSRSTYLHILKPCVVVLKTPDGEVLSRRPGQKHYVIKLHDEGAAWKEID